MYVYGIYVYIACKQTECVYVLYVSKLKVWTRVCISCKQTEGVYVLEANKSKVCFYYMYIWSKKSDYM